MGTVTFSDLEISAIGEIINISLGASATAVSNMLDAKVDITTPKVSVLPTSQFDFSIMDPALCTEISYRVGLDGKNGLLLKLNDVRIIVEMLMHTEIPREEFELSDLYMSAICEVMNQMMGASATALSEFLGRTVDISTPYAYMIEDPEAFKESYFDGDKEIVTVSFNLKIGDRLESEFINIMRIPLAKELLKAFIPEEEEQQSTEVPEIQSKVVEETETKEETQETSSSLSQAETEKLAAGNNENEEKAVLESVDEEASVPNSEQVNSQTEHQPSLENMDVSQMISGTDMVMDENVDSQYGQMQQMMQQMQKMMTQMQGHNDTAVIGENKLGNSRMVNVHPIPTKFSGGISKGEEQMENKELVMGVPLELSVEIGRTRKTVREILELTKGSLVVLDKLAGEQVDLFVNGKCIARGDVVVVEDNFGIRVTEIVNKNEVGI